jgi:hypothetical protein
VTSRHVTLAEQTVKGLQKQSGSWREVRCSALCAVVRKASLTYPSKKIRRALQIDRLRPFPTPYYLSAGSEMAALAISAFASTAY